MDILLILEVISVLFNIIFIILLTKEKKQCWIYGIIGSLTGAYVFYEKLYLSESILYTFYGIVGVFGYYYWDKNADKDFKIKRSNPQTIVLYLVGGLAAGLGLGFMMTYTNADKPYYDAMSTSFGVLATFLELYKYFVAWAIWIAINAYSIWLYGIKELNFFALQMVVFTTLSIYGYWSWNKKLSLS